MAGARKAKVWGNCNIYPTAKLGSGVNVGAFTEIGPRVVIGKNVRIGAMCFIPEGVVIEAEAWVGPRTTFTNDRFPPSEKRYWEKTLVRKGARIGAGCIILPGLELGEGCLIGAGSTVTKSVPPFETWCGVPAKKLIKRKGD